MSKHQINRLCRARELSGLNIGQAAKLLDMDATTLHDLEDGNCQCGDECLQRLADLYHVPLSYLHGADLHVPESFREMLDRSDITSSERDTLLEFAGILSLYPPQPSARERIAAVAAKHTEPIPPRAAKVRYVKSQGQTRNHHCHWPGCDKQVPPAMWGCRAHRFKLPKTLRDRIWSAYRPGQERDMTPSAEYLKVANDVQLWIREHGGSGCRALAAVHAVAASRTATTKG